MTDSAEVRLQRLLGGATLAPLRTRLRRRFERAPLDDKLSVIRIGRLSAEEHALLASLIGRSSRYSSSMTIDVAAVDAALQRAGLAKSLQHALEQLDGRIVHLAKVRLEQETAWSTVVNGCRDLNLARLLQSPAGLSFIKRTSRQNALTASDMCRRAEEVLQRLPAKGVTRSQLAAEVLGDAHALDDGQATAGIVLAVWRLGPATGSEDDADLLIEPQDDTSAQEESVERSRDTWSRAGVLVNELARPALFLNLPTHDAKNFGGPPGEPVYASLRSLLRSPPGWNVAGRKVYVCENPNVIAIAADALGPGCAPMVCTEGMPGAAQRCLLSQLAKAQADLCYHGDFDWAGIRIGNHVMREHGARSWRFTAVEYDAAAGTFLGQKQLLTGSVVDAFWDKALTAAMQQHRLSIPEEALVVSLLPDLDGK